MQRHDLSEKTLVLHESREATAAYDMQRSLRADERYLVDKFLPQPPADLLDLGCGNGRTTLPLQEMGYHVQGVEYSPALVSLCHSQIPHVPVLLGDARQLPFSNSQFDAVFFSWNGIDYMRPFSERRRVFDEAWRVLRPNGVFLFSSHNALGCVGRLMRPPLLAKRAIRFWMDQISVPRRSDRWYCYWRDDALGMPVFYSAPPFVQRKQLVSLGWDVIAVRNADDPARAPWSFRDVHIHYVCRKPAGGAP